MNAGRSQKSRPLLRCALIGVSVKITEAMEVVIERRCYFKVVWEESIRREYLSRDLKEVKE